MDPERIWLVFPRPIRQMPADLGAVVVLVLLTNLSILLPVINETPLRVILGLPLVLFLPGYAFIAALFPEAGGSPTHDDATDDTPSAIEDRGIDSIERVALSFGLSIAITPLIGLILNFTPFGIRLLPILVSLSGFTILTTAIAAVRRWELPEDERFTVPYRDWIATAHEEIFKPDSRRDAGLNIVLGIAILLAVSSVVYAIAVPPQGEQFTEFYLLDEDDDGELVAANYPEELVVGSPSGIHVGIANNEYEPVSYTVVTQIQLVETDGNETHVRDRTEIDRWSRTLEHNQTHVEARDISLPPGLDRSYVGENRRLMFLLYNQTPPTNPTRENAYREVYLWVDVVEDNE